MRLHFPFCFSKETNNMPQIKELIRHALPSSVGCRLPLALGCRGARVQGWRGIGRLSCNCLPLCAQLTFVCDQSGQNEAHCAVGKWFAMPAPQNKRTHWPARVVGELAWGTRGRGAVCGEGGSLESVDAAEFVAQAQSERTGSENKPRNQGREMLF